MGTMERHLSEIGNMLENPPRSKEGLLQILRQATRCFFEVEQSPSAVVLIAMKKSMRALIMPDILRHNDRDVRILVASCISEIMRITAPEAPYSDDVLREIFQLMVAIFYELHDIHSTSFSRILAILETVAKVRSCVLMLDLQCDDLILKMFNMFFSIAREDHPENVLASMQTIMISVLNESEIISEQLLSALLSRLRRGNRECCPAAYRIAMNVVKCLASKLEPNTDQLDVRLNSVKLVGCILAIPGPLVEEFQPLISGFLKRFGDKSVEVRLAMVEYAKKCLFSNPFRPDAPYIAAALSEQLLDFEETVRKRVVSAICDVANCNPNAISSGTIRQVAYCLRDKTVSVRKYTLQKLAEVYRVYCSKCFDGSLGNFELDWIPGKVLRSCCDKAFRPQTVEVNFFESIYPSDLPLSERVRHWIVWFSQLEGAEIKALEEVLVQKQRFQLQMQSFLLSQEEVKKDESPELQIKILSCFRNMSWSFEDPAKAEESFSILIQINDNNIWKALSSLLDPSMTFIQAQSTCKILLKWLGERHPLYGFMKILATRCSYLLFSKEHVKEILKEIAVNKLAGNDNIVLSTMNLLLLFVEIFPSIAEGSEKDLLQLLKDDNYQIKDGVVRILAKTGGIIYENIFDINCSGDILLEKLCLEGNRNQAKFAVQAIGAVNNDPGFNTLSVLYKRLVAILENDDHLATVLQSLGCIAQIAMPIFETQEEKIIQFICHDLLRKSSNPVDVSKTEWEDRSDVCFMKMCGIKMLVKCFLPNKDAYLKRKRIKALFGVLTKLISAGEISEEVKSSEVDKAHLRLAAATAVLRLSMQWDSHVTPKLFYLTLRTSQDVCPYVRKKFLAKVHCYLKDGTLDKKYACSFVLSTPVATKYEFLEARQYLDEFIEACHQDTQLNQSCSNSYADSSANVLTYLIHTLAHHPDFPVSDYGSSGEAFEPFYWQLHLFVSVVLQQDQSRHGEKVKELDNIPLFMTIFRTIKRLEDAVDKSKSENLHILCDLGLLIIKDLTDNDVQIGSGPISISFPSYYRSSERSEDIHMKVDGSHLPPCLVGDDVLRRFKGAILFQKSESNHDQKQCSNANENGTNERENENRKIHSLKRISKKRAKHNGKEYATGETKNPEMVNEQKGCRSDIYNKSVVLRKFDYNKSLQVKSLESKNALEQPEENSKRKILEMIPNESMSADFNVLMSVTEVLAPPKRKRGRPSKGTPDMVSHEKRQGFVVKDSSGLKLCRPKLMHQRICGHKQDVQNETVSPDSELVSSESGQIDISRIALVHQSYGKECQKTLGRRSGSEGKTKLPDLGTIDTERVSDGFLGEELTAINKQLEENEGSEQFSTKDWMKRLNASQNKTLKTMKQLKSTIIEEVPKEFKSADDNVPMSVAEASFPPKRKRGRPSKVTADLVCRQALAGKDSNQLNRYHPKKRYERSFEHKSNLQRENKLQDSKVVSSGSVQDDSRMPLIPWKVSDTCKMEQDQLSKKLPELPSSNLLQGRSESIQNGLELSQCRQGRRKGLGKKSNCIGKIKLPDRLLGAELTPNNLQLDENKDSGQVSAKSSKSRLDVSHDKFSETAYGVKTVENHEMVFIVEPPVSSKRKQGPLSKGAAGLASQDTRHGFPRMNSNDLKLPRPERDHERSIGYKADVPKNTELPDSKLETSEIAVHGLSSTALMHHTDELIDRSKLSSQRSSCLKELYSESSDKVTNEEEWKRSDEMSGQFMNSSHHNALKTIRQSNSTIIEKVPNEVKSADDNVTMAVAEALYLPKRKRGRPSKTTADFSPQENTQAFSGKDSNGLKSSQPKQGNQRKLECKPDVKEETKSLDSKLIASESAADGLSGATLMCDANELMKRNKYKAIKGVCGQVAVASVSCTLERKEDQSSKKLLDFPSADHQKDQSERSPEVLEFSDCRRGNPKGSGKTCNSKVKNKLPDLKTVTAQIVSNWPLGVELCSGTSQLEEKKAFEQSLTKDLKKRLDSSHHKVSKTMDKHLLESPKVSTKIEGPGSESEDGHLHKKMYDNLSESIKKGLHDNGYNLREALENPLNRKSICGIKTRASNEFEKKDVGEELVGQRIKVWWPLDEKFYIGVIDSYDTKKKKHKITYEDGDVEKLRLENEQWELINGQVRR